MRELILTTADVHGNFTFQSLWDKFIDPWVSLTYARYYFWPILIVTAVFVNIVSILTWIIGFLGQKFSAI